MWDLWWRSGTGAVYSEYFLFPYQFSFHRLLRTHHLSSGAGTAGQSLVDVPSELSLSAPYKNKKTNNSFKPVKEIEEMGMSPAAMVA
jgi:hypothetical protein